jgi:hypothetical protein
MQFIESNSFGVRAAVYELTRADSHQKILLFPMIHVGSLDYYEAVRSRLSACDLVLAEGVKTRHSMLLTASYRVIGKIRNGDLVTQQSAHLFTACKSVRCVDMTGEEFEQHWSDIPWRSKALLYLILPLGLIYGLFFLGKKSLAKRMELNDLPSRNETLYYDDALEPVDDLIVDQRDARLIDQLTAVVQDQSGEFQTIGIVYGARHMRAATGFLLKKVGFHICKSDWIQVFSF